jgi:hypothetical protein
VRFSFGGVAELKGSMDSLNSELYMKKTKIREEVSKV